MKPSAFKRMAAVAGSTLALVAGSAVMAQPANALSTTDLNNISIVDQKATYRHGDTITVNQSGLRPGVTYKVGQCLYQTHWSGIPGCTNYKDVVADAFGRITTKITLVSQGENVHKNIPVPGIKKKLDFTEDFSTEIVTVAPHSTGYIGKQAGDSTTFSVK
ncbi:neocarzinostatin apoprotein domain-containing protein [Rothia uropygialis]|uniref:neocarzinostatin apoprotein domain-containing protein n=1 Tax=Kocuria sp. 36 TaxID=1415402 RepID=UPI00101E13A5|nr:neocarzinostatin apoprotein domain-containing protein [Kocuria sp. 36]